METLTKTELKLREKEIIKKIKEGAVFIHPTDTIYGLGCNALDKKAVNKIRKLKERTNTPFSVWVPSLAWVKDNCHVDDKVKLWLKKLPGPYTLILKLKDKTSIADNVAPGLDSVGVRYPDHWFGKIVEKSDVPIITTSANKVGQPFMTSLQNLDKDIEKRVEFVIYEGEKSGHPSKIINVEKEEVKER